MIKKILFTLLFLFAIHPLFAQTQLQNTGWFMFVNSTKFNEKWGLHFDFQVRSADNWNYVRNVLVRPGITYYINDKNNITAGYAYVLTNDRLIGIPDNTLTEQRVWEQYMLSHRLKGLFVSHRLRLEQRFMEQFSGDDIFAQRFRYFIRLVQPLGGRVETFEKGVFVALQNEVFLNIQNKELLNKSLFDQNRLYFAAGYRLSKKFDIEAGYMKQYSHGVTKNTLNQIAQLALYTRF